MNSFRRMIFPLCGICQTHRRSEGGTAEMDHCTHERGVGMLNTPYVKKDTIKNFFPVPNAVFDLGLHHMEINIYAYLLRIEDRRTYQALSAIQPSQRSWASRSTPWQNMLPHWRSMASSAQSAQRSSPEMDASAMAVSGTPSCR